MAAPPWYIEAFRSDYRDVYAHRNLTAARSETTWLAASVLNTTTGPVLDDCCGFGRHSLALAERGFTVYGIDLSHDLLSSAPELDGPTHHILGRLAQADMRALPFPDATFQAVVNLFTSFGYLGPDGDARALDEMARVLAPSGTLVMDLMNPRTIRENLRPSTKEERDGIVLDSVRRLEDDGRRVVKEVTLTLASGEVRRWTEQVRMFEPAEIDDLLAARGLAVTTRAGDFSGRPYDPADAERQIVVARRQ